MNAENIRKYAEIMKELGLTGLEITEDNKVVRLERNEAQPVVQQVPVMTGMPAYAGSTGNGVNPFTANSAMPDVNQSCLETMTSVTGQDYISVKSPIVGVFYAAPSEDADPFVVPGDRIEKGKTLCIIEAMKLMNEVCAEEDGVISEICVTNGQVVEYGTELFRIRR